MKLDKDRPYKLTVKALMEFDSKREGNTNALNLADVFSLNMPDMVTLVHLGLEHGANGTWKDDGLSREDVAEHMSGNLMEIMKEVGQAYARCMGLDLENEKKE